MSLSPEPTITVNGVRLSEGQAMAMRVSLMSFASYLQENGLGDDEVGKGICAGYLARANEIFRLMAEV
jgi:hypothetical protein